MCFLYKEETKEYICYVQENKRVDKVASITQATELSKNDASALLKRCTKKLKGFKVIDKPEESQTEKSMNSNAEEESKTPRRNFTAAERKFIYTRDKGRCGICGEFIPPESFTIDHIVPISKGGTYDFDNLQCCCKRCNQFKADSMPDDFFDIIVAVTNHQIHHKHNKKMRKKLKKILKK